jgi:hypothetical protein
MLRRALIAAASLSLTAATVIAPASHAGAATTTGKELLAKLTVEAESTRDYRRTRFMTDWLDRNGDCQDTRSEVLQDESSVPVTHWGSSTCNAVRTGRWVSWYDDKTSTNATQDLQIDHVVALSEAWDSGAWAWTKAKRKRYANDLGFAWTLDAVTGSLNQAKLDHDPVDWLPDHHVCKYARHWIAIKYRWKLSIDTEEKAKLAGILTGNCGALDLTTPKRAR